jgi:hypothetical protein
MPFPVLHKATLATPSIKTIRIMDSEIRTTIKDILRLPVSTSSGLLHIGKRDGGLDIPKLGTLVISTKLKQGLLLLNNLIPGAQALATATQLEHRLQNIARSIRIQWLVCTFKPIGD